MSSDIVIPPSRYSIGQEQLDESARVPEQAIRKAEDTDGSQQWYRRREELKRTLRDATSSAAWLRTIIDTIPAQAYCNLPDGTNEFSNQRWQDYTGQSSEQSSGWGWQDAYHPEDLPGTMEKWRSLLAAGVAGEAQARLRRHDGVYRWFLFRCEPLRDESGEIVRWYGVNTDIDELKRTEEKLREDEREFRRITDAIPHSIIVLDPDGNQLYANQTLLNYTGLDAEDVGSPGFRKRIVHPEDIERLERERQTALAGGEAFEFEERTRGKDGVYRWHLVRYNPFRDEQGALVRWYATGTEIDDHKRTECLLESERDRLRLLLEVHQALVANLDLENLFASLGARLRDVTGCDFIGLSLPDSASGQLRQRLVNYREGKGAITEGLIVPLYGSASGRAFRTHELVYMDGAQGDTPPPEIYDTPEGSRFYRLLLEEGIPSGYFVPLIHNGKPIAVMQLTKYAGTKFRTQQTDFLNALAGQLSIAVANALEHGAMAAEREQLEREQIYLREEIERSSMFEEIVGSSEPLRRVLAQVSKVAPMDSTVLIQGETGTGKELLARAIHNRSARSKRAFVRINCAAIPEALVASELFGHEKGSFTGAIQRRIGRFEMADGGTIFLDEVGELPPDTQIALLRVLQEREFERLGGTQTISIDVRIIAATNRDLDRSVSEGIFRQDLFYRLSVFPIKVPPLRERTGDITLLLGYMIDRFAQKSGKKFRHIDKHTMDLFCAYDWPGNIRELQNVVERAVILCEGDTFAVEEAWLKRSESIAGLAAISPLSGLVEREKEMIEKALADSRGIIGGAAGAASKLGIPRQTLESKIKKLGIRLNSFKP